MKANLEVLAGTKAENSLSFGKLEGIGVCIGRHLSSVDKLDGNPAPPLKGHIFLVLSLLGFFLRCCFCALFDESGGLVGNSAEDAFCESRLRSVHIANKESNAIT